jgi:hypothetical protein
VVTQSHSLTNNLNIAVINKRVPGTLDMFANDSAPEYSLSSQLDPSLNKDGLFYQYSCALESPYAPRILTILRNQFDR